jgi:hypothetical protein
MRNRFITVLCIFAVCIVGGVLVGAERDQEETRQAKPKHTSVRLFHKFETKKEKDDFVQQFFDVFGEQKGVLLASVSVQYTWHLETKTIILVDDTGRTGVPSVVLQMHEKPSCDK